MMGEGAARPGPCGAAVFVCGAAVMIFEIAGSRVLAPYAGASLCVWTSLIGVILASLSAGYWSGGSSPTGGLPPERSRSSSSWRRHSWRRRRA